MAQVAEVMSVAFIQVFAQAKVDDALRALQAAHAEYVVIGSPGSLLGVISAAQLRAAANGDGSVETLIRNMPALSVAPDVPVSAAARHLSADAKRWPRLAGVVVQEQGNPKGVLTRQTILEHTTPSVMRGAGQRLEGSPLDVLRYECPIHQERTIVAYYDPAHPPRCSKGDLMQPVED